MLDKHRRVVRAGERTNSQGRPVSNKILLSLPDSEYKLIRPELEFLNLPDHRSLYESNRKIEFVYFPNAGLISLVVEMKNSKTVEVGILGNEGFSGGASIFGLTRSPICEMVQIAGDGFRVKVIALLRSFPSSPQLQASLGRYSMVLSMQISQTAGCNRLHDIGSRLARWLLMAQDRVDAGLLVITHDFISTMLGTDRQSVSSAAANLQRKKIISYTRGSVRILNRKKLEESACECYQVIQQFNGVIDLK